MEFPVRLNKYLAHTGVASRREADVLISTQNVLINGKPATMGQKVEQGDAVEVVGKTKEKKYYAYYKGRGVITHSPGAGEVDIETRLKQDYGITGISPIGRLDKDSEGLMLLSNDGRMTGPLLDPKSNTEKEYEVLVDKSIGGMFTRAMASGVDIEGYRTRSTKITINPKNQKRFTIVLTEGKKHQIRRMCAALGYQVQSLKRTRIANIELGSLKPNQYRKLTDTELKILLASLDLK